MPGTPLPKDPPRVRGASATVFGAYPQVYRLERKEQNVLERLERLERLEKSANKSAKKSANKFDNQKKRVINARILGYLMLEGPSDNACQGVALEVNSCGGDEEKMLAIGEMYFNFYIRSFKMYKGRTPAPSNHASRPSFDTRKAMIKGMLVQAPQNHQQAKANALVRDGFRCVISGVYDWDSVEGNKELGMEVERDAYVVTGTTQCAHIFPESTNANIYGSNAQADKHEYASGVWAVMERFGSRQTLIELNGSEIHRLENILTLDPSVHTLFDKLQLWLEHVASGPPNTYRLCSLPSFRVDPRWKRTVTFTTPDPVKLPVPSPWYLDLHAACCRVAHLSGAGECIDKILRDMEDIQVLSQDGASAEILHYALSAWSQEIPVH